MNTAVKTSSHLILLDDLSKLPETHLDAYLAEITASKKIDQCEAIVHCRYILSDGNGRPRVNDLARKLSFNMLDYAIPRSKRDEAIEFQNKYGSSEKWSELNHQARGLFTDLAQSGEGGETLLYLLAETYLKIPQVSCKMPLKTSTGMHIHGSDGLHAKFDKNKNKLALYWCESKLHNTSSSAISECFKSIAPYLVGAGGSFADQERDLQLLRSHIDLRDSELEDAFLDYLNPDSKNFNTLEYRGLCLIGFDSSLYPSENNKKENEVLRKELEIETSRWCKSMSHYISKEKLANFNLEIFCLPFPEVEEFRKAFLAELRS